MARNKTSGKGADKKATMKKIAAAQKLARSGTSVKAAAPIKPVPKGPVPMKAPAKVAAIKKPLPKKPAPVEKAAAPVAPAPSKAPQPAAKAPVPKATAPAPKAPVATAPKVAAPAPGAKVAPSASRAVPPPAARGSAPAARAIPASAKPPGQTITAPAASAAAQAAAKAAADKAAAAAAAAKKNVNSRHGFKTSEWIVYPAHGVGRIVGIEEQEIAGISLELFVITFEKDKMTLRVPTGKSQSVGMRKLAEEATVKKAMETLKGKARVKRTMWSRRAQEYEAKINSGDLISIAEVVRDLYRSESQPEQSYSERQLYEAALDRMAREIAAVEKLDERGAVQRITEVLSKSAKGRRIAAEEAEIKAA